MMHLLAQISTDNVVDVLTKVGWPGVVLLLVMRGLERLERAMEKFDHTMKGLAMGLWMELASRPHADPFIKATAQREIAKMEAREKPP